MSTLAQRVAKWVREAVRVPGRIRILSEAFAELLSGRLAVLEAKIADQAGELRSLREGLARIEGAVGERLPQELARSWRRLPARDANHQQLLTNMDASVGQRHQQQLAVHEVSVAENLRRMLSAVETSLDEKLRVVLRLLELDGAKDEISAWLAMEEMQEISPEMFEWKRTTEGRLIVMLVVSVLRIDPRVEREARALAARGWQVRIVAPDISNPPHSQQPLDWGPNIEFKLVPPSGAQYVMQPPWLIGDEMYEAAIAAEPFAYHCHDLNTAVIGLRAARHVGARWVCDFHEWSSENVTWDRGKAMWVPPGPRHRLLLRWAETLAIRFADEVITVNELIAHELDTLGGGRSGGVRVVRNIPSLSTRPTRPYPPLKEQLGIPPERFVVLYQGGTGPTRLLEPVIEALSLAPKATLVIRGPSLDLFGEGYRQTALRFGVQERLILADPVPSRDVVAAGRGADAGLWTLPNLSKNFYYALPNKIFEYLASGLPLLVANFPEPKRIVESQEVGLPFDPYDAKSIASQINRLIDDPALTEGFRARVPIALSAMNADTELVRFADIYDELRAKCDPRRIEGQPQSVEENAT